MWFKICTFTREIWLFPVCLIYVGNLTFSPLNWERVSCFVSCAEEDILVVTAFIFSTWKVLSTGVLLPQAEPPDTHLCPDRKRLVNRSQSSSSPGVNCLGAVSSENTAPRLTGHTISFITIDGFISLTAFWKVFLHIRLYQMKWTQAWACFPLRPAGRHLDMCSCVQGWEQRSIPTMPELSSCGLSITVFSYLYIFN